MTSLKISYILKLPVIVFRSVVYLCVGCLGDPKDYDTIVRLYRDTDMHEEKERLFR
jgi:hypothetical protein